MSVDAFGRASKRSKIGERGPPGEGYKLTSQGDYDLDNRKLRNLADPAEETDAVTLKVLNNKIDILTVGLQKSITARLREYVDQFADNFEKQIEKIVDNFEKEIERNTNNINTEFHKQLKSLVKHK